MNKLSLTRFSKVLKISTKRGNQITKGSHATTRTEGPRSDSKEIAERFFPDNERPLWEELDPIQGVPCWEALWHFVDRSRAETFFQLDLGGYGDEHLLSPSASPEEKEDFRSRAYFLRSLERGLMDDLFRRLRSGALVAQGFSSMSALDAPRQAIQKEHWENLELDVRNSVAVGRGLHVSSILIFDPSLNVPASMRSDVRVTQKLLREWYLQRVESWPAGSRSPSRKADVRAARDWFGVSKVTDRMVFAVRNELAPVHWHKGGRPSSTATKGEAND